MTSSDWVETVPFALVVGKALIGLAFLVVSVAIALNLRKRDRLLNETVREIADDQPFVTLPDDGQTIRVYADKSRVVRYMLQLTILGGICTAAGVGMWSDPQYQIGAVLMLLCDLLLGIYLLLGVARLISRTPVLIVSSEGITDNATLIATGMGMIRWREILGLLILSRSQSRSAGSRSRFARYLTIVADDHTIVRAQALWKRALLVLFGSSICVVSIHEFLLPMPLEELQAQIEEYLRAHGHELPLSRVPAGADIATSAD